MIGSGSLGSSGQGKFFAVKNKLLIDKISKIGTNNISGWSVSLASDGRTLAIGGPFDDGNIGATWIFVFDGSGRPIV